MYSSPTYKFPKNRIPVDHRPALDRSYTQRKLEDDIEFAEVDTEDGPIGFGGKTRSLKQPRNQRKTENLIKNENLKNQNTNSIV